MRPEIKVVLGAVMIVLALAVAYAIGNAAEGFEITVENTTDKVVVVTVMTEAEGDPTYRLEPHSSRNIPMDYDEYFICVGFERELRGKKIVDVHKCTFVEITEDNLYDNDGDKLYFEISE